MVAARSADTSIARLRTSSSHARPLPPFSYLLSLHCSYSLIAPALSRSAAAAEPVAFRTGRAPVSTSPRSRTSKSRSSKPRSTSCSRARKIRRDGAGPRASRSGTSSANSRAAASRPFRKPASIAIWLLSNVPSQGRRRRGGVAHDGEHAGTLARRRRTSQVKIWPVRHSGCRTIVARSSCWYFRRIGAESAERSIPTSG